MKAKNKRSTRILLSLFLLLFVWSCSDDYLIDLGAESLPGTGTWLIDESYILWGCSGQDCIPNLTNPKMVSVSSPELSYLSDNDLVVGVKKGNDYFAFPHPILDWHEVINMNDYSISYCPLTGSALHILDDRGYGVSGMLYNSNLIMYDKESNSFWPQMLLRSASGKFSGEKLETERMIETTWGVWKKLFPESQVVSSNTGFNRNYLGYPYGSYKTNNSIFFPINNVDDRLHSKTRVLGILSNDEAKAYTISDFDSVSVIHDDVGGKKIVIFGSSSDNIAVAYETDDHFTVKAYDLESGVILFTDDETGSEWNIFGVAVAGSRKGEILTTANSFISFWFSWAAFYPETSIWIVDDNG
ncbi:MAG: DUF3179 domain-containing protein [Candidatus Marinimicrobia bacterium]|nr:DUF3179 domain-containing protein [Candidatus Neomarinimicrobiota bacterium]